MLTRTGFAALISAIALAVAGRVFAILEFFVIAAAIGACVLACFIWVLLNRFSTKTSRNVNPKRVHAYDEVVVKLETTNRYPLAPPIRISDHVEGEMRAQTHLGSLGTNTETLTYKLLVKKRGDLKIGPLKVRTSDPFSFAAVTHRGDKDTKILVLPRLDSITAPPKPSGSDATRLERIASRQSPVGEEFASLRSYVIGDDLRKVNWKASSRSEDLVVRVDEVSEEGETLITIDLRSEAADKTVFEHMVSACASILAASSARHDRIRLLSTHGDDLEVRDAQGYDKAMTWLARVDQRPSSALKLPRRLSLRALRRSDVGVFIAGANPQEALGPLWQRSNKELGSSVVVLFADARTLTPSVSQTIIEVPKPDSVPTSRVPLPEGSFIQSWQSRLNARALT